MRSPDDLRKLIEAATWAGTYWHDGMKREHPIGMYLKLADALSDLLAEREWRPIETAKKDGTEVWVYAAPYQDLPGFQCRCGYHSEGGWCVDELREVTHWMPLPPPPAEKEPSL